jgi:hypothetical protein
MPERNYLLDFNGFCVYGRALVIVGLGLSNSGEMQKKEDKMPLGRIKIT